MVSAETDAAGLFFLFSSSAHVAVITVTTTAVVAAKIEHREGVRDSVRPHFPFFRIKRLVIIYKNVIIMRFSTFCIEKIK
jgi:hypothetical protein